MNALRRSVCRCASGQEKGELLDSLVLQKIIWSQSLQTFRIVTDICSTRYMVVGSTSSALPSSFPFLAMNLVMASRHVSASRLGTTSTCITHVVKRVKRQHHRFFDILLNLISNDPNYSAPVVAEGKTFSP